MILRSLIPFVSHLLIFLGFSYQAILVCLDYFLYKVVTDITILDRPPDKNIPTFVMCDVIHGIHMKLWQHSSPDFLFDDFLKDNITIHYSLSCIGCTENQNIRRHLKISRVFGKYNSYCVYFNYQNLTIKDWRKESCSTTAISRLRFWRTFTADRQNKDHRWRMRRRHTDVMFGITSSDPDFDSPLSIPVLMTLKRGSHNFILFMSYTLSIANLSPPPLETNCRDYRKGGGFKSRRNCVAECVRKKTIAKNFVLNSIMIEEERIDKNIRIFYDWRDKAHWKNDKANTLMFTNQSEEECKKLCHQPDCQTIVYTPILLQMRQEGGQNLSHYYYVDIHQPKPEIITLQTRQKIDLLDFFVYTSSCISFWFGFCPLNVARRLDFMTRKKSNKSLGPKETYYLTLLRLQQRTIHELEEQVHQHEKSISEMKNFLNF